MIFNMWIRSLNDKLLFNIILARWNTNIFLYLEIIKNNDLLSLNELYVLFKETGITFEELKFITNLLIKDEKKIIILNFLSLNKIIQ